MLSDYKYGEKMYGINNIKFIIYILYILYIYILFIFCNLLYQIDHKLNRLNNILST